MKKSFSVGICVGAVMFVVTLCLCLLHGEKKLRIGVILPLSGSASYLGSEIQRGIECQRSLWRKGGVDVSVEYYDSKYTAKGGIDAFQALMAKGSSFKAVLVAGSTVANAVSEYQKNLNMQNVNLLGILVSSEKASRENKRFYRCWPSGDDEAMIMGSYLVKEKICKSAGVIFQNDELGLDGKDAFVSAVKEKGVSVSIVQEINKDLVNVDSIVSVIMESQPEGVYFVGSTPPIGNVAKQLRARNYTGQFFFTSTLDVGSLREIIGEQAINGILYTSMFVPSCGEAQESGMFVEFKQLLEDQHSYPNMLNVYGAVALALAKGMTEHAQTLGLDFRNIACSTIIGELSFNDRNGVTLPMFIKRARQVKLGEDTICQTVSLGN